MNLHRTAGSPLRAVVKPLRLALLSLLPFALLQVIMEEKTLTAQIERGMASDAEVRFERESEQSPGITPGDVVFKFRQAAHGRFRRDRDDLHYEMHLTLKEALIGG